jgi:hypothetical protein
MTEPSSYQMKRWREDAIEKLPWVKRLKKPVPCEGVVRSKVRKDRPVGSPGTMCTRLAKWHYGALPTSLGESGNYCMSHIFSQGMADPNDAEHKRMDRWMARNPGVIEPSPRARFREPAGA